MRLIRKNLVFMVLIEIEWFVDCKGFVGYIGKAVFCRILPR